MRTILRIAICWVAFAATLMMSGLIGGILHLPAVPMPGNTPPQTMFLAQLVAGLVLVVGIFPLARGLAHAFTVGLYGLVGATFLPMILRVTHSVEIACDSFAYAGLLVLLFAAPADIEVKTVPVPHDPHPLPI